MRTLNVTPAMRATLRAYPAKLPGLTEPTAATLDAMEDVRDLVATHGLTADVRDAITLLRYLGATRARS